MAEPKRKDLTLTTLQKISILSDAAYLSGRPLPTAPDGQYDWEETPDAMMRPEGHSGLTNILNEVSALKQKGLVAPDPKIIGAFIDGAINDGAEDDRKGAFAAGLTVLSRLPEGSDAKTTMSDKAITMLYNSLPHPPAALLGPVHTFRNADGSGNNLQYPDLGKAGMPYARSVQGKWALPAEKLPDPGLVFDCLLKRRKPTQHPGGNSSLTFAFASLVTHSLFRTDFVDWNKNNTSSYLDLSVVYGIDQTTQDRVRDKASGRGLLWPDTFSEERLLLLPPAASALLVVLSRNHNYIARNLLTLNERGQWTDPPPADEKKRAKQDEEIFQTARLINGGHFMSLIMGDYVAGFLGLGEGNAWNMNAFDPIKENGVEVERGKGNHCSVEFNVLYRWHPTTSVADEKWTDDFFNKHFDNKPFDKITPADFGRAMVPLLMGIPDDPRQRTFGGMTRNPDGTFPDDALAAILHNATENAANSYGAMSTPECLRVIEVMGITNARRWGCCSMNEFRKFLGLKQFESFEEWNPDPDVAGAARRLYGHINNLELYTGLQCESIMPLSGGLRFACGYTMTRAVLGDAICLVRGDRFYTTAFTPANLTTWGYQDTMRDPNNGGGGGNLPKLLMRTLPRHYPFNSVYGCFPFFTPTQMKQSLTRQGIADRYTFTRPVAVPETKVLNTFKAIDAVFADSSKFHTMYDMSGLGGGYGFLLCFDGDQRAKHNADLALALHSIFPYETSLDSYKAWYRDSIASRIKEKSWRYNGVPGRYVDVVNDIINVTAIHWAADKLCGITLKTKENPSGLFTEMEVVSMFQTVFQLTFLSFEDNEHGFSLRYSAAQGMVALSGLIAKALVEVSPDSATTTLGRVAGRISQFFYPHADNAASPFLQHLTATGRPVNELVAMIIGLAVGSSVNYAQAAVNVINFYLDESREYEKHQIVNLIQYGDSKSDEVIKGYVREAMRLDPQFTGLWREATVETTIVQGKYGNTDLPNLKVKPGDRLFASFKNAHLNPTDFENPTQVNPSRKEKYRLNGTGFHNCPGVNFAEQTITEIVKVVFGLRNVRRAPGKAGSLKGYPVTINETKTNMYLSSTGKLTPWPESMHLVYDG